MLQITIPPIEKWDEKKQEFVYAKGQTLRLEHSLASVSKWESRWHKAFFGKREKTFEETVDYVRCMTITQNVDSSVYDNLTNENIAEIDNYISDPMTATYFSEDKIFGVNRELVTAELIYYWMVALNIPFSCEKWHLNRLLTLVKVCNIKNQPPKKVGKGRIMRRNSALNAQRRKRLNTKG